MPIFFDRFAAAADRVADTVFGGEVRVEPQAPGGYTGHLLADPDRPAMTVTGVSTARPAEETLSGQAAGEARVRGLEAIAVRKTVMKFSSEVVARIGYGLREGDRMTLLGRGRDNVFAVADVVPSDLGDLTVHLVNAT
jgi:hypothetical protein